MPEIRINITTALLGFTLVVLINVGALFYWGGRLDDHLEGLDRRVGRIESFIDKFTTLKEVSNGRSSSSR